MGPNQRRILIGTGVLLLAVYAISSVLNVQSASDRLALDRRDLSDLQRMLSEIDAVAIATPVRFHFELTKKSLLVGKHTFITDFRASFNRHSNIRFLV